MIRFRGWFIRWMPKELKGLHRHGILVKLPILGVRHFVWGRWHLRPSTERLAG